jgi:hypothetical protein
MTATDHRLEVDDPAVDEPQRPDEQEPGNVPGEPVRPEPTEPDAPGGNPDPEPPDDPEAD